MRNCERKLTETKGKCACGWIVYSFKIEFWFLICYFSSKNERRHLHACESSVHTRTQPLEKWNIIIYWVSTGKLVYCNLRSARVLQRVVYCVRYLIPAKTIVCIFLFFFLNSKCSPIMFFFVNTFIKMAVINVIFVLCLSDHSYNTESHSFCLSMCYGLENTEVC